MRFTMSYLNIHKTIISRPFSVILLIRFHNLANNGEESIAIRLKFKLFSSHVTGVIVYLAPRHAVVKDAQSATHLVMGLDVFTLYE